LRFPSRLSVVVTEYDNPGLDVRGAELFSALCERDGVCPRFVRLNRHNHLSEVLAFNTPDEYLGREILDFIDRGRYAGGWSRQCGVHPQEPGLA
jgi:acetyl esterase